MSPPVTKDSGMTEILLELRGLSTQMTTVVDQVVELKASISSFQDNCRHDMSGVYKRIAEVELSQAECRGAEGAKSNAESLKPHKGTQWATIILAAVTIILITIEVVHHMATAAK